MPFLNVHFHKHPEIVLQKFDPDEVYQYYKRLYKADNLADFYLWLVDNHCHLVDTLVNKLHRLYRTDNPFNNAYYALDAPAYLYSRKLISFIPRFTRLNKPKKDLFNDQRIRSRNI